MMTKRLVPAAALAGLLALALTGWTNAEAKETFGDLDIEDSRFRCIAFINSETKATLHHNQRLSDLTRFWLMAFLSGMYDARDTLEFSGTPVYRGESKNLEENIVLRIKNVCRQNLDAPVRFAAVNIAQEVKPIPAITQVGFDPRAYTCESFVTDRQTGAVTADTAAFWAFAFVQGHVTERRHPRLVIDFTGKTRITVATARACERNPHLSFFTQVSEVAEVVRPEVRRR